MPNTCIDVVHTFFLLYILFFCVRFFDETKLVATFIKNTNYEFHSQGNFVSTPFLYICQKNQVMDFVTWNNLNVISHQRHRTIFLLHYKNQHKQNCEYITHGLISIDNCSFPHEPPKTIPILCFPMRSVETWSFPMRWLGNCFVQCNLIATDVSSKYWIYS